MSRPTTAIILPIADIVLPRDSGRKLRICGFVTAYDPSRTLSIVSHEGASIFVDLSLCVFGEEEKGGWRDKTIEARVHPPEMKSKVMILGTVERLDPPLSPLQSATPLLQTEPQLSNTVQSTLIGSPNPSYILRALILKELQHTYDLSQWVQAARVRSAYEWSNQ